MMDDITKKLDELLVNLFNDVLKIEEDILQGASSHNLSITEIHTLAAIGADSAKTMTQVATILKVNVSTLTAAVNKLVEKSYVNRFRVQEDRRIVKIELTESGKKAVKEHEDFHMAMCENVIGALSSEEQFLLVQSLENIQELFRSMETKFFQRRQTVDIT